MKSVRDSTLLEGSSDEPEPKNIYSQAMGMIEMTIYTWSVWLSVPCSLNAQ